MQRHPPGEYEMFRKWSGRPRSWGAGGEARVWFGGQVLDGLCSVLDDHLAATGFRSAAIGCVPWLTSDAVVDRLALGRIRLRLTMTWMASRTVGNTLIGMAVDGARGFMMVRDSDYVSMRALARRRQGGKNGHMQIMGAFLAQHAEIVDQKLSVTGGVLDWIGAPMAGQVDVWGNPIVATYFLVTLMQAGPEDHQRPYRMTTEAARADGISRFLAEATISVDAQVGENRFIVQRFGVNTEMSGRNVLVQTIDGGGSVAVPAEVRDVDTHPS